MTGNKRVLLIAVAVVLWALWALCGSDEPDDAQMRKGVDRQVLLNHMWFERPPKDARTFSHGLLLATRPAVGALGYSSAYSIRFDAVRHSLDGDRLTMTFLQERVKTVFRVRTWRCEKEAPRGMDTCLDLSAGGKSLRLYTASKQRFPDPKSARSAAWSSALRTVIEAAPEACDDCVEGLPAWFQALP